MIVEKEYWAGLLPPLAPSKEDVDLYSKYLLAGSTLLLGSTRQLIDLSDVQMDIDPQDYVPNPIKQDWAANTENYTNIVGDGVTAFTKELCDGVIEMASKHCKRLIVRSFNRKLPTMRIAAYFPGVKDFTILPSSYIEFEDYTFYVWNF